MRYILIILVLLLLGSLFYAVKNRQCCGSDAGKPAATSISNEATGATDKAIVAGSTANKGDKAIEESTTKEEMEETKEATSSITQSATTKSFPSYNHADHITIQSVDNLKIIPFSKDNKLNVEVQALMEETCSSLQNSLSKVNIRAYGKGQGGYLRKMEDFLIRCGVSPSRVRLSHHKTNDDYKDQIVFSISE